MYKPTLDRDGEVSSYSCKQWCYMCGILLGQVRQGSKFQASLKYIARQSQR